MTDHDALVRTRCLSSGYCTDEQLEAADALRGRLAEQGRHIDLLSALARSGVLSLEQLTALRREIPAAAAPRPPAPAAGVRRQDVGGRARPDPRDASAARLDRPAEPAVVPTGPSDRRAGRRPRDGEDPDRGDRQPPRRGPAVGRPGAGRRPRRDVDRPGRGRAGRNARATGRHRGRRDLDISAGRRTARGADGARTRARTWVAPDPHAASSAASSAVTVDPDRVLRHERPARGPRTLVRGLVRTRHAYDRTGSRPPRRAHVDVAPAVRAPVGGDRLAVARGTGRRHHDRAVHRRRTRPQHRLAHPRPRRRSVRRPRLRRLPARARDRSRRDGRRLRGPPGEAAAPGGGEAAHAVGARPRAPTSNSSCARRGRSRRSSTRTSCRCTTSVPTAASTSS